MSDRDIREPLPHREDPIAPDVRVAQLWRYPVKSLLGERLSTLRVVDDGVEGDRAWGIQDCGDGRILTARREPRLLFASSNIDAASGLPVITLPDGKQLSGPGAATDAVLSAWLSKPVTLVSAAECDASRAEYFADATDDASGAIEWTMPKGRFVDAFPLLIMTAAGLRGSAAAYPTGSWDPRRFRPNIFLELEGEGWLEDAWSDCLLSIGSVQLVPRRRCVRCTMVNRAQPDLERDVNIYKTLHRLHQGEAGMWTQVVHSGWISEGNSVHVQQR
jgi:uncharacterized protein YcbX